MNPLEIWRAGGSNTGASPDLARAVEAQGWDGQMFMDSQSLSADPYAQMGAWAVSTRRMLLSPGVTNPFTRNLAVTAAGIATVQSMSGGRAVLGIGRGDSALAYLGHAPVSLRSFEAALETLQALLSGEEVAFERCGGTNRAAGGNGGTGEENTGEGTAGGEAPASDTLSLGARPEGVRLKWLQAGAAADLPKVPLDVAATGPRVIAMAARLAERVTFSVGAQTDRIAWALGVAREARVAAGSSGPGPSYGAQIVVVCHPDMDTAMDVAMTMAPPLARFQVIQGAAAGPHDAAAAGDLDAIRRGYDMTRHGDIDSKERIVGGAMTPEFVGRFAIVGPPDACARRLLELHAAGIGRFVIVGPGFYPAQWGEAGELFAREVIPALHIAHDAR